MTVSVIYHMCKRAEWDAALARGDALRWESSRGGAHIFPPLGGV